VPEQTGLPYLVVVAGRPGVSPMPGEPSRAGVARLQGRAAAARAVGRSWLRLQERWEQWPAVSSALGPESVRELQGLGWVPTWGVAGFGEHKSVQDPGHRRGAGAAGWEPQWWLRHVLWWPLGAKDSGTCPGRNVGAPCVPSRPSRLPRSCWGGRGLRGAGVSLAPTSGSRGLWVQVLLCLKSLFEGEEEEVDSAEPCADRAASAAPLCHLANAFVTVACAAACCVDWSDAERGRRPSRA